MSRILALLLALGACASELSNEAGSAPPSSAPTPTGDAQAPSGTVGSAQASADVTAGEEEEEREELPSLLPSPPPTSPPPASMPSSRLGAPDAVPVSPCAAKMQWVITNAMKSKMRSLGYFAEEIEGLDPERAAAIVDRSIRRPSKGVPHAWMREVTRAGPLGKLSKKLFSMPVPLVSAATTVMAALLFGISKGKALSAISIIFGHYGQQRRPQASAPPSPSHPQLPAEREAELWLDRQYDRLVLSLAKMIGR